ncbi:unnamed protein product [Caenorhabditis brenneri]
MRKTTLKILKLHTPEKDSKDQIKRFQDALDDEEKKTAESQAQCVKEKEKVAHSEHRLHQKMKEIQDMEKKDVASKEEPDMYWGMGAYGQKKKLTEPQSALVKVRN